jgi:hypothetical protein
LKHVGQKKGRWSTWSILFATLFCFNRRHRLGLSTVCRQGDRTSMWKNCPNAQVSVKIDMCMPFNVKKVPPKVVVFLQFSKKQSTNRPVWSPWPCHYLLQVHRYLYNNTNSPFKHRPTYLGTNPSFCHSVANLKRKTKQNSNFAN